MPIDVNEQWQKFLASFTNEDDFDPAYVRQYFVNNVIQRVLSLLYACDKDTGEAVKLRCLSDGSLIVATAATGMTTNQVLSGTAGDTEAVLEFDNTASRVDIWVYDYDLEICRSSDGLTYQDWIKLKADSFYSFDASTMKIKVKNAVSGQNAGYQIVGWW